MYTRPNVLVGESIIYCDIAEITSSKHIGEEYHSEREQEVSRRRGSGWRLTQKKTKYKVNNAQQSRWVPHGKGNKRKTGLAEKIRQIYWEW